MAHLEAKVTDGIYRFIPEGSLCWTWNAEIIIIFSPTPTPVGLSHLLEAFKIHSSSQLVKQWNLSAN